MTEKPILICILVNMLSESFQSICKKQLSGEGSRIHPGIDIFPEDREKATIAVRIGADIMQKGQRT